VTAAIVWVYLDDFWSFWQWSPMPRPDHCCASSLVRRRWALLMRAIKRP